MKKKKEVHPAVALVSKLKHLFNRGGLFEPAQRQSNVDKRTTKSLTVDGRQVVQMAVRYCLENNVKPKCSVSGDDGRCDEDVSQLKQVEYEDLIDKLELIPFSEGIHFRNKTPL